MTTQLKKKYRKVLLLVGLPILMLTALGTFFLPTHKAYAGSSGQCQGGGVSGAQCIRLDVVLSQKPPLSATIEVKREKGMGGNNPVIADDDFYVDSTTDNAHYSSGGYVNYTSDAVLPCNNPQAVDQQKFDIQVRYDGKVVGSQNGVNLCGNASPKPSTKNGALVKTLNITTNIAGTSGGSKLGGIKGVAQATKNGKTVACQNNSSAGASTSVAIDITRTDGNNNTKTTVNPNSKGEFNTGYTLQPGTYKVYVNCVIDGGSQNDTYDNVKVTAGKITDLGTKTVGTGTGSNSNGGDGTSGSGNDCQITGPLAWIECPVLSAMNWFAYKIDGVIASLLTIDTKSVFSQSGSYYKVWNSFRNIAVGLIVVAGLVMVFGQALGVEIMDAYTIRKVLPRLLIAAIGITLSWAILQYVTIFFNNLGNWVGDMLTYPFNGIDKVNYQSIMGTIVGSASAVGVSTLVLAGAFFTGALTIEGLIAMVGIVCLALLIALLTLTVRNMIIIVGIVTAPLAIAAYILPGTQKLWKFWKDAVQTSYLMFPIVMAFLSAGKILASVSFSGSGTNTNSATVNSFIGLLAYAAPYFLLPMAFKMAGGLIANFTGMVNDRTRGGFDRLKNRKRESTKRAKKAMKEGTRWNESRWLGKGMAKFGNRAGRRYGAGISRGYGYSGVGQAHMANSIITSAGDYANQDGNFKALQNDENAMVAHAFGNDRAALARLQHFQQRDANGNVTGVNETAISDAIARSKTIDMSQQSRSAAADALVSSGKIIQSREEAQMLWNAEAGGDVMTGEGRNQALFGAAKGRDQYNWRQKGRNDIGRGSDEEALREMNMQHVSSLKPIAADNLFGTRIARNADGSVKLDSNGRAQRESGILNAIRQQTTTVNGRQTPVTDQQRQHYADLLFAAQYNPYTTAEQQASIQESIRGLQGDATYGAGTANDLWANAQANYTNKMRPGASTGSGGGTGGGGGTP